MEYKLLALDVDGTLLNSQNKISTRTQETLIKAQQKGIRIVLVSGRPTYGLLPIAKQLNLGGYGGYIISYNGGQIINAQNGEILFERRINPEMLPYIERKAEKIGFPVFTYHDDTLITNTADNIHIEKEAQLNHLNIIVEPELSIAIDFAPCKCMLVSDNETELKQLEEHWKKRLSGTLDVYRSEKFFLEVVPNGIDKATTLSALLEKLSVLPNEVIAIGDGICDVSMLQIAGLGIAMKNAEHSVKVCADSVTDSNDEDGVANAVINNVLSDLKTSDITVEELNRGAKNTLVANLGIQYTYVSEGRVEATMPVNERTRQPFGVLHGGATLALAETVAGMGSLLICKSDEMVAGMQVSGNHISSALEGDTVRAVGTIIHKGRSSHVWNIDVYTSTSKLVSTVRIVNSIFNKE